MKSSPKNLYPFTYIWEEFEDNKLVSPTLYTALDRAGEYIIIDATQNKAKETIQIRVTLEQY